MRFLWAGLILLLSASGVLAQATGSVVSLGFNGEYRPDCWTPLLVELNSTIAQPATYQVRVQQRDLDKDTVVYARTVTVNPQVPKQRFWVYFLPQTVDKGLPGPPPPGEKARIRLADVLKVNLYDKAGSTLVANLRLTDDKDEPTVQAIDVEAEASARGVKFVLVVRSAGGARHEYANAQGLVEDVRFVDVTPDRLPDHLLGYAAVDAVLWLDAKLTDVRGTPAFAALQEWVRQGGNLAVCNPSDRAQLEPLDNADMLPIKARDGETWMLRSEQKADLKHLLAVAGDGVERFPAAAWEAFERSGKTFEVARAAARPDAMVDAWVQWPELPPAADGAPVAQTPLIARRAYGLGSVAWVAQDLGNPALLAAPPPPVTMPATGPGARPPAFGPAPLPTSGWSRIWDRVFGWRSQTRTAAEVARLPQAERREYDTGPSATTTVDLGEKMAGGVEHTARGATYIFVAVLFFVGYWVVAGPGSYLFLAARKKQGLSWGVFAASGLVATALTVLVVKLLLGGGTEVRHVSVVRLVPDAPAADGSPRFVASVWSRLGLYIPRDGAKRVAVAAPTAAQGADRSSWVSPMAVPPKWVQADAGFTDSARYVVDTDPILAQGAPEVYFVFRSTLKKVQARWTGSVAEGITGQAELDPKRVIAGKLTNATGRKLTHVHFVFTYGQPDANSQRRVASDRVLYLPEWDAKAEIELADEYVQALPISPDNAPGSTDKVKGALDPVNMTSWTAYLYRDLGSGAIDDSSRGYLRSFTLMSLIDRVGAHRVLADGTDRRRVETVRRGGRAFDMSPQVAAGRLVILAQAAKSPAPAPVDVEGERVAGEGVTFYQVALPLSREKLRPAPVTRPATTRAASGPATRPQ